MNDLLANISATQIFSGFLAVIGGLVAWLWNNMDTRVTNLEDNHEELTVKKLDKEEYYRDQGIKLQILNQVQGDVKEINRTLGNLPKDLLSMFIQLQGKDKG